MQKSGIGTIGEISSFGSDLDPCLKASHKGMRIVFFNEILGTNENQVEDKKQEFLKRFENSLKFKNDFLSRQFRFILLIQLILVWLILLLI